MSNAVQSEITVSNIINISMTHPGAGASSLAFFAAASVHLLLNSISIIPAN